MSSKSQTYFSPVPRIGSGDLVFFRDACVTSAAARRWDSEFFHQAPPEAVDMLRWLGIQGTDGSEAGRCFLDLERRHSDARSCDQVTVLAATSNFPSRSLDEYRGAGYLAETMFATLVRSSYGPDSLEFFPTLSELGFYFDEALLLSGEARWEEEYLTLCQAFFMEELTPTELLEKSLDLFDQETKNALSRQSMRWQQELHGVTFLVASGLETLKPLSTLLSALLGEGTGIPELGALITRGTQWTSDVVDEVWESFATDTKQRILKELCPGFPDLVKEILYTLGPEFLAWRTTGTAVVT